MAITVTATQGGSTFQGIGLRVRVLTNTASVQSGATASAAATCSTSISTTVTGSQVYGAFENGGAVSAVAGTTLVDNYTDTANNEVYGSFRTTSATGTPGATTVGGSGGDAFGDVAAVEILPSGTITEDASSPAFVASNTVTAITTAAFTPPAGALLVAMVGSDGGATGLVVTTMTVSDSSGLTWTEVAHAATVTSCYAGVWIARVTGATNSATFTATASLGASRTKTSKSVGTATLVRATSSPVTATYGAGQNAGVVGNLLVAIVTAAAATSVGTTSLSTGSGWTKQSEIWNSTTNAGHALVAIWTKPATVTPEGTTAFASTLSGTGAMTCTIIELVSVNLSSLIDTSGSFSSSGSGTGTATVAFTETTAASVSSVGEFAISAFCQERTATTVTWTETGSGWLSVATDGSTSSVAHTQINVKANPTSGATLSDSGNFSTNTSGFGAGVVVVFKPAGGTVTPFSMSATATLAAPPVVTHFGTFAPRAVAVVTASRQDTAARTFGPSAVSTLSVSRVRSALRTYTPSITAVFSVSTVVTRFRVASPTVTAQLSSVEFVTRSRSVAPTATAILTAIRSTVRASAFAPTSTAILTAVRTRIQARTATLVAVTTLSSSRFVISNRTATFSIVANLSAVRSVSTTRNVTITVTAQLSAIKLAIRPRSVQFNVACTLSVLTQGQKTRSVSFAVAATLATSGLVQRNRTALLTSTARLMLAASSTTSRILAPTVTAKLAALAYRTRFVTVPLTAVTSLFGLAYRTRFSAIQLIAMAQFSASGSTSRARQSLPPGQGTISVIVLDAEVDNRISSGSSITTSTPSGRITLGGT